MSIGIAHIASFFLKCLNIEEIPKEDRTPDELELTR